MAIIDKIVLKDNNNVSTSYDISVKGENVSGTVASATTATKLASSNGSATQPVYFSDGKPVACTHTLGASVPANAKFTDTDTWRPLGTTADTACAGNDSRLSNARPASDVYSWAKASTKPSYAWSEITGKPTSFTPASHTHNYAGSSSAGGDATNALKLGGYSASTSATKNTVALRDGNGYLYAAYFNQSSAAETPTTSSYIVYADSSGWFRKSTLANIKTILGLGTAAYTASTAYAPASHTHSNYLTGINKSMVTTALGYTPPTADTNTWRGIANSLNSTDQSTSLSLYGGKLLNDKITAIKTTRKMYKVVPLASNYVSPYKFYTSENLTSEASSYGTPIYASASGVNGVPLPCQLYQTSAGTWYLGIAAMTDYTISYYVTYLAGVTDSKTY